MLPNFHYPKLGWLLAAISVAYFLFRFTAIGSILSHLGNYSYLGVFFGGVLFSYGFSSPFAAGLFLTIRPENIFLAAIIGGFGALLSDLFIFHFIKFSFSEEFESLERTRIAQGINATMNHTIGKRIKHYLIYAFAGFLIASPLPDEAGIILFASATKINTKKLAALSFCLNTIGIFVLLMLGAK